MKKEPTIEPMTADRLYTLITTLVDQEQPEGVIGALDHYYTSLTAQFTPGERDWLTTAQRWAHAAIAQRAATKKLVEVATLLKRKPTASHTLGYRGYGTIGHLPGSKVGEDDSGVDPGQARLCTTSCRPGDEVFVQAKLDGGNVSVYRDGDTLIPLTRKGNRCTASPHEHHHLFVDWMSQPERQEVLRAILSDGERLIGEWLAYAHGIRYDLTEREPWVVFDLMRGPTDRLPYDELIARIDGHFTTVPLIHRGTSLSIEKALKLAREEQYRYGAIDEIEGVVYRVETKGKVNFLAKYVLATMEQGRYWTENDGAGVWNWRPFSEGLSS